MEFAHRSHLSQVARLRAVAFDVLRQYPLRPARLRLLVHAYNTTFRVDTDDGRTFALRLNTNSRKSISDLHAEMSWLAALSTDTDLRVPTPQPTVDGRLHTEVFSPEHRRNIPAALFGWLRGSDLDVDPRPERVSEVGRAMAVLHAHAEGWALPAGATLPALDTVLLNTPNNLFDAHPELPPARAKVVRTAYERIENTLATLFGSGRTQVLHADIHLANLKWYRGRLSVFDFDDCGIGMPVQDLAISAYYLRPDTRLEQALNEGYASLRPLPVATREQFEAVVASRSLVLLNDLLVTETAEFRAILPRYAANTALKLQHYLDAGEWRHDLPGVVPLSWETS
jgi:Ser/Thr protein kinase RdoA (MazF antagonist)